MYRLLLPLQSGNYQTPEAHPWAEKIAFPWCLLFLLFRITHGLPSAIKKCDWLPCHEVRQKLPEPFPYGSQEGPPCWEFYVSSRLGLTRSQSSSRSFIVVNLDRFSDSRKISHLQRYMKGSLTNRLIVYSLGRTVKGLTWEQTDT